MTSHYFPVLPNPNAIASWRADGGARAKPMPGRYLASVAASKRSTFAAEARAKSWHRTNAEALLPTEIPALRRSPAFKTSHSFRLASDAPFGQHATIMELTKFHREAISRAIAAAIGIGILYLALGCFRWGEAIRTDPVMDDARRATSGLPPRSRAGNPIALPYTLALIFGAAGGILVGFAIVPTRALYAINPRHWEPEE